LEIAFSVAKGRTRKPEESSPPLGGALNIGSVRLEPMENVPVYYVNFIEVGNSPQDFSLLCARLPSKLTASKIAEAKELGALLLEPEVQIIIPTTLVPGLIRALTAQKENYEKLFATEIKEVGAPQIKQVGAPQ
jgi:hypothetical protein